MRLSRCGFPALGLLVAWAGVVSAQPTYKLEVKPNLKPLTTVKLDGDKLVRTDLADDPGFRLQFAFKKDGKPAATVEARSNPTLEIPDKTPGKYSVAVELFYPAYKGGTQQKGQFKAVSNEVYYDVKPPTQPGGPVQIVEIEAPKPPPAPEKK